MTVVPDTSAVIDGRVSERVESGAFEEETVAVPEAVVAELEFQANDGRESGWDGLAELQRLAELADEGSVEVEYVGRRPGDGERHASDEGAVDALIRDLAAEKGATLLTSDKVQSEVARAKELDVEYVDPEVRGEAPEQLAIEDFFDEETMSVHLKTGVAPMAKRGAVGEMRFETIGDDPLTEDDLREWVAEIETATRASSDGFTELDRNGMTIVQFGEYRIALARPPFADGLEITAVRPIVETELDDYEYADDLRERLLDHQRGVLIAGAPGAGKSTLAGAVAGFLADSAFSVKTMEKPRDLQVGPEITQYTELDGQMENTADSLLMVRPDYTIYDEVRKTEDFSVFADMRLAGVGMIGVVHATRAIDALGRLVGRVELGMIPQVVDTVVYVEAGEIDTVYDVRTEVKVPEGLTEEDLARPVIQVRDFETQRPEYEIYSFNRQVVTVPVGGEDDDSGVDRIAKQEIEREIRSVARGNCEVELKSANTAVVYVEEADISTVIGKGGGRITDIENRLGISIDVRTFDERPGGRGGRSGNANSGGGGGGSRGGSGGGSSGAGEIVTPEITSRHVVIPMDGYAGETVEVQADGEYLFTATVSRGGEVQVSRGSAIAEELEGAIDRGQQVTVAPS
ncbi:PINc/VapC family ATPase [Halococcus saccharolyticus]|uniref:ATPase n=1 Tax=Halococcus saccharolyticus DSM 5350 TaxID=1227455 RepID=M0MN18_9EURY|nr:PINc/VapC family ATPase [Halococcus saccharolyticus]EMA45850.1 ATPase [Halococcus saccharolyticus DSM 5350]